MYVQSERSRKVATTYKQEKFLFFLFFFFFPFSAVHTLISFAHIYFAHVAQCAGRRPIFRHRANETEREEV